MPKYENENPLSKLHEEEPYFFIRAQDQLSVDAVRAYAELLEQRASDLSVTDAMRSRNLAHQAFEVGKFAEEFLRWQELNPALVKLPD